MYQIWSVHVHILVSCWIHAKQPTRFYNSFLNVVGFISLIKKKKKKVFWIGPKSPAVHSASEELRCCEEGAFVWIQIQSKSCSSVSVYSLNVLEWTKLLSMYEDMQAQDSGQDFCYATRKDLSGKHKTEGQKCLLIASLIPCKCCYVVSMFIDDDLPVAVAVVQVALNICCICQFCWTCGQSLTLGRGQDRLEPCWVFFWN